MNSFLYYFPTPRDILDTQTPDMIRAAGFEHAFESIGFLTGNPLRGASPDGQHGMMVTDSRRLDPGRNKYDADAQIWLPHKSAGYWVGMWKDAKPGPEDLLRSEGTLPGTPVRLGDGNDWIVPQARSWSMEDDPEAWPRWEQRLPVCVTFDTSSKELAVSYDSVQEKYAYLAALAEQDARFQLGLATDEERTAFTPARLFLNALRVLNCNYLMGPIEANLLKLFVNRSWTDVFAPLNDWPGHDALMAQKKTRMLALQRSSAGPEDKPLSTDPPSQT